MAPHEVTISPEPQARRRLRRDLEFTHRQAAGATEVIACDPVSGRYFRAGELEAALFTLLDGETPLAVVVARLTQEFPGLLAEEVTDFVAQLDRIGFLEGSPRVGAPPRTPLYRRLLYAQVRLANPDRLFAGCSRSSAGFTSPRDGRLSRSCFSSPGRSPRPAARSSSSRARR